MPAAEPAVDVPRVTAILVTRNGVEWLPYVFKSLERYRYPALDVVAVDNGSRDGSAELLRKRLGDDRVVVLQRNAGFGRAVAAALARLEAAQRADLLLLLHDDMVLEPDALRRLVRALLQDEHVSVVGPKLREWRRERVLQQVGMTIDRFGRAESGLDPDELDQGQRDTRREVLYVPTAGMLLRREVFSQVGGFDARYPAFRDDLDLCWRAWLAGLRVEVLPRAVGYHVAAAGRRARRFGTGRRWESRFLAERHSIATLLKNYGLLRLLWVLPVLLLLGVVKTVAFLASRRFGDALATVLAWVWNLFQLPKTLRRRREVQRRREVSDGELTRLFAPGLPRLREYKEALGSWLAGGSTRALIDERDQRIDDFDEAGGLQAALRGMREHAVATVGVALAVAYLIGAVPLLGGGQIVGGDIAPWPESAAVFWSSYATPWGGEPLASSAFASPIQGVLGLVSLLGFGSAWVAQRVAVLGLLPLAWVLAVRAGRLVSPRVGPRVLGATIYVLSPPVLGALAQGRYGPLIVAALLPALLLLGVRAADASAPSSGGWRAAALRALTLTVAAAADPTLLPLVAALWAAGVLASLLVRRDGWGTGTVRLLGAGAAAALLLAPWLTELAAVGGLRGARGGRPPHHPRRP
jgi:GT2 family glycosyltransferase